MHNGQSRKPDNNTRRNVRQRNVNIQTSTHWMHAEHLPRKDHQSANEHWTRLITTKVTSSVPSPEVNKNRDIAVNQSPNVQYSLSRSQHSVLLPRPYILSTPYVTSQNEKQNAPTPRPPRHPQEEPHPRRHHGLRMGPRRVRHHLHRPGHRRRLRLSP